MAEEVIKKVGANRLPALGIDLFLAGLLYIGLVLTYLQGGPTSAELGYSINSTQVTLEQKIVVLLGLLAWFLYAIAFAFTLKKTLGQWLVGIKYSNENPAFVRLLSILFTPALFFDFLFKTKVFGYSY